MEPSNPPRTIPGIPFLPGNPGGPCGPGGPGEPVSNKLIKKLTKIPFKI